MTAEQGEPTPTEAYLRLLERTTTNTAVLAAIDEIRADISGVHSGAGHAAIAAELVACTLGARRRPELRADLVGSIVRVVGRVRRFLGDLLL